MNHYPSGLRVVYALLATGLGFMTNLDAVAAFSMDDLDTSPSGLHRPGELHLVVSPDSDHDSTLTTADAAYAQSMQEHISHLG